MKLEGAAHGSIADGAVRFLTGHDVDETMASDGCARAIAGASQHKVAPSAGSGAAFVLSRTGSTWAMGQEIDGDPGQGDFGQNLAFDGATLVVMDVVGTPADEGARIYGFDGGTFAPLAALPGSEVGDTVKPACVIQGSTLVTGTRANNAVFVLGLVATDGDPCSDAGDCDTGFCVDGVCCASPSCPAAGPCNAAEHCQPGTGLCSNTPIHEGMACDANDACMADAVCQHGACVGPTKTCAPPNECQEFGTCDPATGACSSPPKPDGTACAGGMCMGGRATPGARRRRAGTGAAARWSALKGAGRWA